MSVLTNPYFVIPTISVAIQVIVFALLVYGYWLFRRFSFQRHGKIMSWALVLHLIAIFSIMVPSLVLAVIPEYIVRNVLDLVSIFVLIHVPLGVVAVSLGIWFVVGWRLKGLKSCFNRRKLMRLAFILWLITLSLGIVIYLVFYWSILIG